MDCINRFLGWAESLRVLGLPTKTNEQPDFHSLVGIVTRDSLDSDLNVAYKVARAVLIFLFFQKLTLVGRACMGVSWDLALAERFNSDSCFFTGPLSRSRPKTLLQRRALVGENARACPYGDSEPIVRLLS